MTRLIEAGDFARLAGGRTSGTVTDENKTPLAVMRDTLAAVDPSQDFDAKSNRIGYIFATQAVARDRHVVHISGIDVTGFSRNPVALWSHLNTEPPIGRVQNLSRASGVMRGEIEFTPPDLNAFGHMVYRLTKARFLNAVSISWLPIQWSYSQDASRRGGIDFEKSDLLEVSCVSVPGQATALANARGAGIDISPMRIWLERMLDADGDVAVKRSELEALHAASRLPRTHHVFQPDHAEQRRARIREAEVIRMLIPPLTAADHAMLRRQREVEVLMLAGA